MEKVLVFVIIFQIIAGHATAKTTASPTSSAQTTANTQSASQQVALNPAWPDRFGNGDEGERRCITALNSGEYRIYVPEDLRGTWRMPLDDKVHFRVVLSRDACVHMKIETGKMEFVPQKADTVFRATRVKGIAVIYARDDCGNEADKIVYPPLKFTVGPMGPMGPQGLQGPMGPQGPKGDNGKDAVVPVVITTKRSNKKWWFIGGAAAAAGVGYAIWYYNCPTCVCPPGFAPGYK